MNLPLLLLGFNIFLVLSRCMGWSFTSYVSFNERWIIIIKIMCFVNIYPLKTKTPKDPDGVQQLKKEAKEGTLPFSVKHH